MTATSSNTTPKTAILMLNMGGPDSLDAVKPFLYNLFSDPDIIKLPLSFLFQKLLAYIIVQSRGKEAQHNYSLMGGSSPQLPLTQEQSKTLQAHLKDQYQLDYPVYIAMRYWHPFTEATLTQMKQDGIERVIVLSMYPHFSYTTTGSSLNELRRQMRSMGLNWPLTIISGYHQNPTYLNALATMVNQGLENGNWSCPKEQVQILFSAHSLPISHVKRTKDPYPDLIYKCAKTLMETHFPQNQWDIAYQSKVGKMPWLGPYTDSALSYYAAKKQDNILMIPISFVTDHIETLVEIDQQYIPQARENGIQHLDRAPSLNSHPSFIQALGELVVQQLERRHWQTHSIQKDLTTTS